MTTADPIASPPDPVRNLPVVLPLAVFGSIGVGLILCACAPSTLPWQRLWLWLIGLWFLGKVVTWWPSRSVSWRASLAYLTAWPGMDVQAFLSPRRDSDPVRPTAYPGWSCLAVGIALLGFVLPILSGQLLPLILGWLGVTACVLILHCGLWRLAAVFWWRRGQAVRPPMQAPLLAGSIGEFWGRRWNLPFHGMLKTWVFLPTRRRLGVAGASLAAFLVSGLLHEVMTSLPAGGGYGLVTGYFLLQWLGLCGERYWRRAGPLLTRIMAWVVILGGAPLLFHPPFVEAVMVPFLQALGSLPSD